MYRFSANLSIMFTEAPFIERFALAAHHGFNAVECWFPYEHTKEALRAELNRHQLKLIGINTAPGDTTKGDWGLAVNPLRKTEFIASVDQAIDYASSLDCGSIHVMAGIMPSSASETDCEARYIEHIGLAADRAKAAGKTVLIEPLNPIDRPGYFLSRQSQAARIVDALKRDNVKIMFDIYHAQMTEGNIVATLRSNLAKIGHIQIADVPGRHEPGTGEINFPFVMNAIAESDYAGWIGCEYKPKTNTAAGLSWRTAYA
ncbi:MAG: 2-oxo-tetronate isomerase [Casimicrobium sp.]